MEKSGEKGEFVQKKEIEEKMRWCRPVLSIKLSGDEILPKSVQQFPSYII